MIKPALAPVKVETVKLVTANINLALALFHTLGTVTLALALQLINTLAPVPAIPVAPAPPATVNILNAIVNHLILGHPELALALQLINTPAPALVIPAAPAPPAVENILPAPALVATSGMAAAVKVIHVLTNAMEHMAKYFVAIAQWLALRLAARTSM